MNKDDPILPNTKAIVRSERHNHQPEPSDEVDD